METVSKFWSGKLISKYRRVYSGRIGDRPGICQTFNDESKIFSIQFVLSGNERMDKGGQRGEMLAIKLIRGYLINYGDER